MNYAEESLRLHGEWQGKIEVVSRVPVRNKRQWRFFSEEREARPGGTPQHAERLK